MQSTVGENRPAVSVTVVLYNSATHLRDCLRPLRELVESGFAELILVDNASPDESASLVANEFPEAQLLRSEVNRGFAGGCNLARPHVWGRYWLLLNPDVILPADGLRQLVEWMDAHSNLGVASPDVVDDGGRAHSAGRRFPSLALALLELSRLHLLLPVRLRGRLLRGSYWRGGDQIDADWVPGAVMLVRREAVEEAGSLSEKFFMYGEDIEWCWRIKQAGWSVGVCSSVQVQHSEGSSARRTWNAGEARWRLAKGVVEACRQIRGPVYARLFALVIAITQAVESRHPHRSREQQQQARGNSRAFFEVLRGR